MTMLFGMVHDAVLQSQHSDIHAYRNLILTMLLKHVLWLLYLNIGAVWECADTM